MPRPNPAELPADDTSAALPAPKRMNSWLMLALCVVILSMGGGAFKFLESLKKAPELRPEVERILNVEVFTTEPAILREIIVGFGTVHAEQEVTYSAQVAGEIVTASPRLKIGESVTGPGIEASSDQSPSESRRTEGDLLLSIDPRTYQEQFVQSENAIAEVDAELATLSREDTNNQRLLAKVERDYKEAQAEHERMKELAAADSITKSQLSKSLLELQTYEESRIRMQNERDLIPARRKQLQTKRDRLETQRSLAAIDLRRTEVFPPFSGVLSDVHVEKGQYVQPGTPLFHVIQLDVVEIEIPLHPLDFASVAGLLRAGGQPRVRLAENETGQATWEGRVVRAAPRADSQTRTISVFIEVDNRELALPLLPGTFVQARIEGPELPESLVVPREAIIGNGLGHGHVFLVTDGRAVERAIRISRRLEGLAFVSSGLAASDELILTNLDVLRTDARIDVQSRTSLDDELVGEQLLRRIESTTAAARGNLNTPDSGGS